VTDYRAELLEWAKGEVGRGRRADYWLSALGYDPGKGKAWCGAFCLAGLHHVGLAVDFKWGIDGSGMVGPLKLRQTKTPSRGDIGYLHAPFQHHFLFDYLHDGWYHSVDGNQPDVREKQRRGDKLVFFSIQPLIDAASDDAGPITKPSPKLPTVWIDHCPILTGMELQTLLVNKGFPLKVDGVFGMKTMAAVKQFQLVSNLTTDGIVGNATWEALLS
jgi:peptidoglycan hydrolase-like protein with peptidoglycan-binding domain